MSFKEKSFTFTVFSGCYNSSSTIHRLFQSVESQSFKDFEWIVMDDGSEDNTVELIEDFLKNHTELQHKFIKNKVNRGISFCRVEAIKMARGKYFVKWDHDDIQSSDQLQVFNDIWQQYNGENIASIWCLCEDENGNLVGNEYPSDLIISDYFSLYNKYIFGHRNLKKRRERHNCIKVDLHNEVNKYLYKNAFLRETEYPTATEIWGTLSYLGYKTVFINKKLRKYFIEPKRKSMSKANRGHNALIVYRDRKNWINYFNDKLPCKDFFVKQRNYLSLNLYGIFACKTFKEIINDIKNKRKKVNTILFFIPALLLAKIYK